MKVNERYWLEQFQAHFAEAGMLGISAQNVTELIRIAKGGCEHHCEECDWEARQTERDDQDERIKSIGKVN